MVYASLSLSPPFLLYIYIYIYIYVYIYIYMYIYIFSCAYLSYFNIG